MLHKRRLLPLAVVAVAAAVYFILAPQWPSDQRVRFVLGDAAPRVVEVDVRYREGREGHEAGEGVREVSFRYARGTAPRIVSHEPRLANGDYVVQMEFALSTGDDKAPPVHVTSERSVMLQGGTTSIDVSRELVRPFEDR